MTAPDRPVPVNPFAAAHRTVAEYLARARAGEFDPQPAPEEPPTEAELARDAELAAENDRLRRCNPFAAARHTLIHGARIAAHRRRQAP